MNILWLHLIVVASQTCNFLLVNSDIADAETQKYCRSKDRLISSDENDEYLLVSAEVNATIILECRFCYTIDEEQPMIWYYQDRYQSVAEMEVELGMDNNNSNNRIHVSPQLALVIKSLEQRDAGIYRCHGSAGQGKENKFNYRIEPTFKDRLDASAVLTGNLTDWGTYHELYLAPVTTRFAISRMPGLADIRDEGITLSVISEWAEWSLCKQCVRKRGFRTSKGQCRLKRLMNETLNEENDSTVRNFFAKFPTLPCKSLLLYEQFPALSDAIRYLPEFNLIEKCKKCPAEKKLKKGQIFRFKKRYVLAEGTQLAVSCPESDPLSQMIVWRKDSVILKKGVGRSFRKKDSEARVIVDTFSTLYLIDVSTQEQGNYTCYVDGKNMMQAKIIVVSKSRLITQAFLRHLGYLATIFLLTSICYCAGLIMACRRKDTFQPKNQIPPTTGANE